MVDNQINPADSPSVPHDAGRSNEGSKGHNGLLPDQLQRPSEISNQDVDMVDSSQGATLDLTPNSTSACQQTVLDPTPSALKASAEPVSKEPQYHEQPYPPFARGNTIGDSVSVEERGRIWQNYKPDKYFLPNDAIEQDRLDFAHKSYSMILNLMKGADAYADPDDALSLAPITGDPPRVLDIGTGTGIWAIEYARRHPLSKVIGSDLSLIQPDVSAEVPNVSFVREDVEDEWIHDTSFDFIHLRLMFTCFINHKDVIQKAFDNLNPGGWIEYQDCSFNIDSDDNTHRGTALHQWGHLAIAGAAAKGRDIEAARKYKRYMEEIGFVDVVERPFKLFGNSWPRTQPEKTIGRFTEVSGKEVIRSVSAKLLGEGLGISENKLQEIVAQSQKDAVNRKIHFYWPGYVVYGRKPVDNRSVPQSE
ncbi:hypothetical protein JX266_004646 [Neoarthrinium moseri]|nr:hypothetical protein JX266_004646 [Neoarthrinium moseri]